MLPSATEIIAELGLADRLVGVSAECRWPEHVVGKPVVSSARVDTAALTNVQIDELVRDSTRDGGSLYVVDAELIDRLRPDLIILVVIAPCGFDAEQAAERAADLLLPCRMVAVDADSSYSRPGPRLADGVRQLGYLLHPDAVPDPGLQRSS